MGRSAHLYSPLFPESWYNSLPPFSLCLLCPCSPASFPPHLRKGRNCIRTIKSKVCQQGGSPYRLRWWRGSESSLPAAGGRDLVWSFRAESGPAGGYFWCRAPILACRKVWPTESALPRHLVSCACQHGLTEPERAEHRAQTSPSPPDSQTQTHTQAHLTWAANICRSPPPTHTCCNARAPC